MSDDEFHVEIFLKLLLYSECNSLQSFLDKGNMREKNLDLNKTSEIKA